MAAPVHQGIRSALHECNCSTPAEVHHHKCFTDASEPFLRPVDRVNSPDIQFHSAEITTCYSEALSGKAISTANLLQLQEFDNPRIPNWPTCFLDCRTKPILLSEFPDTNTANLLSGFPNTKLANLLSGYQAGDLLSRFPDTKLANLLSGHQEIRKASRQHDTFLMCYQRCVSS